MTAACPARERENPPYTSTAEESANIARWEISELYQQACNRFFESNGVKRRRHVTVVLHPSYIPPPRDPRFEELDRLIKAGLGDQPQEKVDLKLPNRKVA